MLLCWGGGHPWVHVGPHTGGASRWVLGVVGVRSLQGVECQWSAGREVHRPPSFCALSLSLANKTHLDALESFWPINTRTCMPKLQSKDGLFFSFLYCCYCLHAHAAILQQMLCALHVPKQFLGISDTNYLNSLTVRCCLHLL